MKHEFYATPDSEIDGTYRIMFDFSDVNQGDTVEISFPDQPTKIVLVSTTAAGEGCDGCAFDVMDNYCEVVDIDGSPICMSCVGTNTIFKDLDPIMEDL